ncbi:MAG: hypothetical protein Kow00108_11420 [Calditrichia bacterium]
MTTSIKISKKCSVCDKTSEHEELTSTNSFGSPDLDLRPPEMKRSTMNLWIQCCPHCGYCAPDISGYVLDFVPDIVKSEAYQEQLKDKKYPELANWFLCSAMLLEREKKYEEAGQYCLNAAWACDDAEEEEEAVQCRKKAIEFLKMAKEAKQSFSQKPGEEEALLADLYRRTSQFDLAIQICNEGIKEQPQDQLVKILKYQIELCRKRDNTCHRIEEALGE